MSLDLTPKTRQNWHKQITLQALLRDRFGLSEEQDPEQHIEPEALAWITTARRNELWRERLRDYLIAGGSAVILGIPTLFATDLYASGIDSLSQSYKETLALAFCVGTLLACIGMNLRTKLHEVDDQLIIDSMGSEAAKEHMRILLGIKNDFRDDRLVLVAWRDPAHKTQFSPEDFEKRNALNLLLPTLGNREMVYGAAWSQEARFAIVAQRPEYYTNLTRTTAASKVAERTTVPSSHFGKFLLQSASDDFFNRTADLSCKHSRLQIERFNILRMARNELKLQPSIRNNDLAGLVAEKGLFNVTKSTIEKIISGLNISFEKNVVFPTTPSPENSGES